MPDGRAQRSNSAKAAASLPAPDRKTALAEEAEDAAEAACVNNNRERGAADQQCKRAAEIHAGCVSRVLH